MIDQRRYMPRLSSILQHADPKFVEDRRSAALSEHRATLIGVAPAAHSPSPPQRAGDDDRTLVVSSPHLAVERSLLPSTYAPGEVSAGGVETGVVRSANGGRLARALGSVVGVLASGLLLGALGAMLFPGRVEVPPAPLAPMGARAEWLASVSAPEPVAALTAPPPSELPEGMESSERPVAAAQAKSAVASSQTARPTPGPTRAKGPSRPHLIFDKGPDQ